MPVGVGHRLRGRRGRQLGGRQDAEYAVAGAVVGRLRRHFGFAVAGWPVAIGLVGFSFGHDRARCLRLLRRGGGIALVIGVAGLCRTGRGQLHLSGLDLDGLYPDRLHRFGRTGDGGDLLGLNNAVGQRRGSASALGLPGGTAAAAAASTEGFAGAATRWRRGGRPGVPEAT